MEPKSIYESIGKDEIRLIRLLPGQSSDEIRCELETHNLDAVPYEALSYEWGSEKNPKSIILRGKEVSVRENLWQALLHIRSATETRTLWIDAICINQTDNSERNHKVGMMGDVYWQATAVRVWLGLPFEGKNRKMFLLVDKIWDLVGVKNAEYMGEEMQRLWETEQSWSGDKLVMPPSTRPWLPHLLAAQLVHDSGRFQRFVDMTKNYEELWSTLRALLKRSYWSRIWIIQEYVLAEATIIQCGLENLSGLAFDTMFELALQAKKARPNLFLDSTMNSILYTAGARVSERRMRGDNRTLEELLDSCQICKSTDPRDMLYGILGLASDVDKETFVVDYHKDPNELKTEIVDFLYAKKSIRRLPQPYWGIAKICRLSNSVFSRAPNSDQNNVGFLKRLMQVQKIAHHGPIEAWKISDSIATKLTRHGTLGKHVMLAIGENPDHEERTRAYFVTQFVSGRLYYWVMVLNREKLQYFELAESQTQAEESNALRPTVVSQPRIVEGAVRSVLLDRSKSIIDSVKRRADLFQARHGLKRQTSDTAFPSVP